MNDESKEENSSERLSAVVRRCKIGRMFVMKNINGKLLANFIIKHIREDKIDGIHHFDGSYSPPHAFIKISEDGFSWYILNQVGNLCI